MGRTYAVSRTLNLLQEFCENSSKSQNTFFVKGVEYFFEVSRREHSDGSATGTIWKSVGGCTASKSSSFRIEGDGSISSGPAAWKAVRVLTMRIVDELGVSEYPWYVKFGEPNEANLAKQVDIAAASYKRGGVNFHISESLGHIVFPNRATIVDPAGSIVAEWKAAPFQLI